MPNPGDILLYKDYEFIDDGTKKDKLFVVIHSSSDISKPCLVLKTTSKSKRYAGVNQGCNHSKKVFFVPTTWQSCFNVDTYIQLLDIKEITTLELLSSFMKEKQIKHIGSLSSDCIHELIRCLEKLEYDIIEKYWNLIFDDKSK